MIYMDIYKAGFISIIIFLIVMVTITIIPISTIIDWIESFISGKGGLTCNICNVSNSSSPPPKNTSPTL